MAKVFAYVNVRRYGLLVALIVAVLDGASKAWALMAEQVGTLPMWIWPGEAGFHFAWNRGMSFSMLQGVAWGPWLLGIVALAACGWFIHWLGEQARGWSFHQVGLGMLIGGAFGNVLDRMMHGAVVDFLLLNPWGLFPYTFNIADTAITCGVMLLLLDSWLRRP